MKNEQFSDDLKKAIEEGFVVIDDETRTAIVGANITGLPDTLERLLLLIKYCQGLSHELTIRHGYMVISGLSAEPR